LPQRHQYLPGLSAGYIETLPSYRQLLRLAEAIRLPSAFPAQESPPTANYYLAVNVA